jgi:hypothetical protein
MTRQNLAKSFLERAGARGSTINKDNINGEKVKRELVREVFGYQIYL